MNTTPAEMLTLAIEHHQALRLEEAEGLYRALLMVTPGNPDALHLLGVLHLQTGRPQTAIELIGEALTSLGADSTTAPARAMLLNNLGNAFQAARRYREAAATYEDAARANPGQAEIWNNLANVTTELGDFQRAEDFYRHACQLRPNYPEAINNLARMLQRAGRHAAAVEVFRQGLDLDPGSVPLAIGLATSLRMSGSADEAVSWLRALAQFETSAAVASALGLSLIAQGSVAEGLTWCVRATLAEPAATEPMLALAEGLEAAGAIEDALLAYDEIRLRSPDHLDAWFNSGRLNQRLGRSEAAVIDYSHATELAPSSPECWFNLGNALHRAQRSAEAVAAYHQARELSPDNGAILAALGTALYQTGDESAALKALREAVRLAPDLAEAHYNLANVLEDSGDLPSAIAEFERAIELQPSHVAAQWNLGLALLRSGDFTRGWEKFEYRWKRTTGTLAERRFDRPLWLGDERLDGKTILLHAEQGLGDTLQFCRYVRLVEALGPQSIILEVQKPLLGLMQETFGSDRISVVATAASFPAGLELPDFDLHCPLMSLPLAFETTLETIPAQTPYLAVNRERQAHWRDRLEDDGRLRVGLVWAGECRRDIPLAVETDRRRSIALSEFAPLLDLPGVHFVSLQKGPPAEQLKLSPYADRVLDVMDEIEDFRDTAALASLLDLVISVDTSVAHLAGALGIPTSVLSRRNGCWRWLDGLRYSPWYPGMDVLHQEKLFVWQPLINSLLSKLEARIGADGN